MRAAAVTCAHMTVIVRYAGDGDAEGFARVRRAALPFMLATPEQLVFDWTHAHPDSHARPFVAVAGDGAIVGTVQLGIAHDSPEPGIGSLNVYVDPAHQGLGAGTLLLRAAESTSPGTGRAPSIAGSWTRRSTVPGPGGGATPQPFRPFPPARPGGDRAAAAPGAALRRRAAHGRGLRGRPRPLFELDAVTSADEPGDVRVAMDDYAHWRETTWNHPSWTGR